MDQHSLAAFRKIRDSLPKRQAQVMTVLANSKNGAMAHEIASQIRKQKQHVMPRLTELLKRGLVAKEPNGGHSEYGRTCNRWSLTTYGRGVMKS